MIETGAVITGNGVAFWHLPKNRTVSSLPDSRTLWEVLWDLRTEDFLGFAHSHPGRGEPSPSMTDLTTFAAVETGLGRRLHWWITSEDQFVEILWEGPHRLEYKKGLIEPFDWVYRLRELSNFKGNPTWKPNSTLPTKDKTGISKTP